MKNSVRVLRYLVLPWLLAACVSSNSGSVSDALSNGADTGSACTSSHLICTGTDTASPDTSTKGSDAAQPLSADASSARLDTTPGPGTPDAAGMSDAPFSDSSAPDSGVAKTDTLAADRGPLAVDASVADGQDAAGCSQQEFVHLTPLELKTLLDSGEDPYLVNVKGSTIKNIAGTDAVLASDAAGVEALVKHDLCANIVLYCRTGVISKNVGDQLIADGYKRVRDLAGGITAWEAAGYPSQ